MNIQTRTDPVARARELGPEIAAAADEIERTQRIPAGLLERMHEFRLFRMLLPRSAGGDEVEPGGLCRGDRGNRPARRLDRLEHVHRKQLRIDRAISRWRRQSHDLRRSAHRRILGTAQRLARRAVDGGYRLTGKWDFSSGCRQANWMGAHGHVVEPDGSLRLNRFGRPTVRTLLFPAEQATLIDTWHTIGLRGTASESYRVDDCSCPKHSAHARGSDAAPRERPALCLHHAGSLCGRRRCGGARHCARNAGPFVDLASRKAPRGLSRLADSALVQADVARMEARLGSARAYLVDTLTTIYAGRRAGTDRARRRARVRLACSNAIHGAIEVAD